MKKMILTIVAMTLLSGCAEFQAIRQAAVEEMSAEIVSEETAIYRTRRASDMMTASLEATVKESRPESLLMIAMMSPKNSTVRK